MDYFCSKCKEVITPREYDYSMNNYNCALCRKHQKDFIASNSQIKKPDDDSSNTKDFERNSQNGLSKREHYYKESMIKGRIAETLVEELFLSLDYSVFRYGMENTVPGIMKLLKGVRSDVATNIRRMPDFVIQKNDKVFFIEVKFRKSEEFKFEELPEDYPYENCYFVIVSKKHIKCISYEELKNGKEITPTCHNYLGNREEFELDKDVIIDFCNFAVKFFDSV
ncbi:hypothetical protein [Methanolobus chelungpuianus]|uniref:Uncharacterized protein n=1 Tax=Methanolobus chelungpuianus TaxID=502115 RepID=A0AAE3KYD7_9EURY|nr:hypothetical protein [Methanolobus chelungpuianus]MCQ6963681.1 hypothetical protein [Methanolobus chelungpuianus]